MTQMRLTRDITGAVDFGVPVSDNKFSGVLVQNVVDSLMIPTMSKLFRVIFSIDPGTRIFVSYDGNNPVIPTGAISTTNSEMNPINREVAGGTIIKFITPDAAAYIAGVYYVFQ